MKALVLYEHGDNDKFNFETNFPDPEPADSDVIIAVKAASLNYHDIFTRRGMPGITLPLPIIIGLDVAGEIIAVGNAVTGWKIGDRVVVDPINRLDGGLVGETTHGGLAERCRVAQHQLIRLPDSVSFADAAALPVAYGTAWRMMQRIGCIQRGEKVLILGASGGVGVCCVQLAKLAGAEVIACAGSEEKAQRLRQLGADDVILYQQEDFVKAIWQRFGKPSRRRGGGAPGGVDVVVNFTGGDSWVKSLKVLRAGGRLLTCGATAGFAPAEDLRYIWTYELQIFGSNGWERDDLTALLAAVERGELRVIIDRHWPLEQGAQALASLEQRQVFGKVIVA
ncbi:zinc-binding dehydrogenase [Erwinia sp. OLTSP20]|uniref:quinone oxidoreductase family protein n=1 Tax=unclassified Erwinia TaxID=2622719 RepID=UPI000C174966|nr:MULTISPECIES: zinc-binding dehydrogenase [unclassified Erwinia]PIJ51729.1 zinc-binding dehydrogenase [Erwinia sp. OAMSP11]PIJ75616.1 zinc-binding dehydrogenase [Erwinia sp. OLSSP12]PIJ84921.1 zinc-binding dehydrogenase [Erwinia sp. OLCASP19]PIJ86700.1 zinc-binding dehydrogenase [Erwinia sp. OLMTSP26]PIJ88141.1 zinc-binding dehydrogenase [Erwinia sp. OLMDSP33]